MFSSQYNVIHRGTLISNNYQIDQKHVQFLVSWNIPRKYLSFWGDVKIPSGGSKHLLGNIGEVF